MPEGHSVHRIARQFRVNFLDQPLAVSSPQGRFTAGAAQLDGRQMSDVFAVGKQMFADFGEGLWLRVHLGLYGAWDFAGDITTDPTIASAAGRMGQTNQRGTQIAPHLVDADGEDSVASIGAPRRARVRMSEQTKELASEEYPPPPVGQVRVRLMTPRQLADLRGPTACEVIDPARVELQIAKLGPDPLVGDPAEGEERFTRAVRKTRTPIGLLLMDQKVVSGIGNVYRAEMLFRARLNPYRPGNTIPETIVRELWRDWCHLLVIGVEVGQMLTIDGLEGDAYVAAMASREDRHWVYKREGLPCLECGTHITLEEMGARKLYWCPSCQR